MGPGLYYGPSEDSFKSEEEVRRDLYLQQKFPDPIFQTPVPESRDFSYWSGRFRQRATEALETEEVTNRVHIRFPETSLISFIGDVHAGNSHVDYDRVEQEVGLILNTPNSFAVLLGDLIDNFFWAPPVHEHDSPVPDQIEYAWALIEELARRRKLLIGVTGNHDDTWGKRGGNTMYKRFARDTGAYLISGLGFMKAEVGEQEYTCAMAHRLPGYSYHNPNHPGKRSLYETTSGADVIVSGHTHQKAIQLLAHQTAHGTKRVCLINVGTYKWTDGFIMDRGMGEKDSEQMYGCAVMISKEDYHIRPYYDILEAHKDFIARNGRR